MTTATRILLDLDRETYDVLTEAGKVLYSSPNEQDCIDYAAERAKQTTPPTTAQLRTQARDAEASLDWSTAADLWAQAQAAYPLMPGRTKHGALALADLAAMKQAEESCRHMAVSVASADPYEGLGAWERVNAPSLRQL